MRSQLGILVMLLVAHAAAGCALAPDPRLAALQQREREFGRPEWIVLPNEQGGEEWISPLHVDEEVRGGNVNEPAEFRLNYATQQRQVWLYPSNREQVRFEPASEPSRGPIEPRFAQRHQEIQATMPKMQADAECAVRDAQQKVKQDRQRPEGLR